MHLICNQINNGLKNNFFYIDILFKKKYIHFLNRLKELNLINSFYIYSRFVRVFFRYYKNKILFELKVKSTGGNKTYLKCTKLKNLNNNNKVSSLNYFSSSKGNFGSDDLFFNFIGGEYQVEICLLNKN